jgi:hypothetical protein
VLRVNCGVRRTTGAAVTGMCTPELHLRTCFVLNVDGRIVSTREPSGSRGPFFTLVRGSTGCAWAVRADVPADIASELDRIAEDEPPILDFRAPPVNVQLYLRVLESLRNTSQSAGPAFSFPDFLLESNDAVIVESESLFERNFRGWVPGEIEAGRAPALAILENGCAVSICFCARRSESAAEAGVETAEAFRRKGLGAKVTAAWAVAVRSTGRIPLYSTSWTNQASLGIARKLNLIPYATSWSIAA